MCRASRLGSPPGRASHRRLSAGRRLQQWRREDHRLHRLRACPPSSGCSTSSSNCTVSGLTNGVSYTFRVSATNSVGTGQLSDPSVAVTPAHGTASTFHPIAPVRVLDGEAEWLGEQARREQGPVAFRVTNRNDAESADPRWSQRGHRQHTGGSEDPLTAGPSTSGLRRLTSRLPQRDQLRRRSRGGQRPDGGPGLGRDSERYLYLERLPARPTSSST